MARLTNLTERGKETQRELRAALMQLILEKGYEQVTIKDITDLTGLERSTFYLHYKDKQALLEQSQKEVIDELIELSGNAPMGEGVFIAFRHMAEHALFYRVMLRAEGNSAMSNRLQDYLVERTEIRVRERIAPLGVGGVSSELIATFIVSALRGTAMWWLDAGMPTPPEEMARLFLALIAGGLGGLGAQDNSRGGK